MADDLMQMQRQAAHRVQQMQEHSRRVFESHREQPSLYRRSPEPVCANPAENASFETDQWLLLGLALLLFRNGCQTELILALLYLAL